MRRTRHLQLLVVTMSTLLVACGGPVTATPTPTGPLPTDQVVFQVTTAGGLIPHLLYLLESPGLVVYGDGRVLTQLPGPENGTVPVRFQVAAADPMAVAAFVARAEATGLISGETDFGHPAITDQGATSVLAHGASAPTRTSVYAFFPAMDAEVTPGQRAARARLRQLIDEAYALAGDGPTTEFFPPQVTVFELPPDPGRLDRAAVWPGPDPASFLSPADGRAVACGHLTGDDASTTYRAALANPGARWTVGDTERILAVNPMPAADDC